MNPEPFQKVPDFGLNQGRISRDAGAERITDERVAKECPSRDGNCVKPRDLPLAPRRHGQPPGNNFRRLCLSTDPTSDACIGRFNLGVAEMDSTLLIVIILVLLLAGGGWYGRGRWY